MYEKLSTWSSTFWKRKVSLLFWYTKEHPSYSEKTCESTSQKNMDNSVGAKTSPCLTLSSIESHWTTWQFSSWYLCTTVWACSQILVGTRFFQASSECIPANCIKSFCQTNKNLIQRDHLLSTLLLLPGGKYNVSCFLIKSKTTLWYRNDYRRQMFQNNLFSKTLERTLPSAPKRGIPR